MLQALPPLDVSAYPGGWSLTAEQMQAALAHVTYSDTLRVLEIGQGRGTAVLAAALQAAGLPFVYVALEQQPRYAQPVPGVSTLLYDTPETALLPAGEYDLVIVDGPTGESRSQWYCRLRPHVRAGTVLVVDDHQHYASFVRELDANYVYHVLDRREAPKPPRGPWVCWLTVRILEQR